MKSLILAVVMLAGIAVLSMAMTMGFCVSTLNNPYFVSFTNGAKAEAQLLNVNLIVMNANNSNSTQFNQVEDLIQRKVDAIILNPTDSDALVPAVKAANKAGIPVITLDRSVNGGKVDMYIASNNVEYGKLEAEYAVKLLNGSGNVVLLTGIPGASATRDRTKGIMEYLSQYPNIKIVANQTARFDMATAMSVMESILVAHPNINAVIAENDGMALGAIQAIKSAKSAGRTGIIVIGGDGIPQGIQAVKNGTEAVDIAQQPYKMAALGVSAAFFIVNGLSISPTSLSMPLFPVTKSTVNQWIASGD